MARTIRGQSIASTHADALGDRITPEILRELFSQLPDESVQTTNHDLSKPPICRGYNKRLERLPDGELALKLDIEVFDEKAFESMGGFSIAFTHLTVRRGEGEPAIRVLLNPTQFDFRGAAGAITRLWPPSVTIDVTERVEKADLEEFSVGALVEEARGEARWSGYDGDPVVPWIAEIRKIGRRKGAVS